MESDSDSSERLVANYFEHHSDDFEYFDDSSSSEEEDEGDSWLAVLQKVKDNDPKKLQLAENSQNINARLTCCRKWEEIGCDVSSNTRLECLFLSHGALDDNKMSFFFRGLTGSCSIKFMQLHRNELSVEGVRTMASFFQNANNLRAMRLSNNNLKSEGFNMLLRALHSSHIEHLNCDGCGIESIEIDNNFFPKRLENLDLSKNNINAEGCRGLAKLLKGGNATLERLSLECNEIDDEGAEILVDALQNNTSLSYLDLSKNDDISWRVKILLMKLVIDISSIKIVFL